MARLLGASAGLGFSTRFAIRKQSPSLVHRPHDAVVHRLSGGTSSTAMTQLARLDSNNSAIRPTACEFACSPRMESPSATTNGSSPAKFSPHRMASPRPLLEALPRVEEMRLQVFELQLLQQLLLVGGAQRAHELRIAVEVVLDGGLVPAR